MEHVLVKVYAAFYPVEGSLAESLKALSPQAIGEGPFVFYEGDMVRISYEGIYFPVEDALDMLAKLLPHNAEGKLDALDLDAWTLTRHVFAHGRFASTTRSLNHVLDYSGH